MFEIHGFDESMLLGWHCDSNLAARLALYRGRVDTLIDKVFGYHCDHTRVAAASNKGRQTRMNNQDQYIWDIATPTSPPRPMHMGLAGRRSRGGRGSTKRHRTSALPPVWTPH